MVKFLILRGLKIPTNEAIERALFLDLKPNTPIVDIILIGFSLVHARILELRTSAMLKDL